MSRRIDFPWTIAVVVLALACTAAALGDPGGPVVRFLIADTDRLRSGELWRALTGPLVHATWGHLARDLAICATIGVAYEQPLRRLWPALLAAGLAVPALAVALAGWTGYLGLSGLGHALIAAALTFELRLRRPAPWYVLAAASALAAKLIYEVATGAPLFAMDLGPGVRQAPVAHAAGALAGALAVLRSPVVAWLLIAASAVRGRLGLIVTSGSWPACWPASWRAGARSGSCPPWPPCAGGAPRRDRRSARRSRSPCPWWSCCPGRG